MPKRSNNFQTLTYQTFSHLAAPTDRVVESAKLKERGDGTEREVDVLIEHPAFGTVMRTAVECRGCKRKQNIQWIDEIIGRFKDLNVDKVLVVSESGFSRAALEKARNNRIDTLALEPAGDHNWPTGLIRPGIGGWCRTDHPQKIGVLTVPPDPTRVQINQPIFQEDGACIGSLGDLGMFLCRAHRDLISETIQRRFRKFFKHERDLRAKAITAVVEGPLAPRVFLVNDNTRHRITNITLTITCQFAGQRVTVKHFALGEARLTIGNVPCNSDKTRPLVAIQSVNKPGQVRCCAMPIPPHAEIKKEKSQ